MSDPYRSLGLRRNPFCVEDEPGVPEALFLERGLPAPPAAGGLRFIQVLGPKGAGKTTALLNWRRGAPGPYRRVPPGFGRWRLPPGGALVYWDEADRVPAPVWISALTAARVRAATVVAGTHEDLSRWPRRLGFSVETHAFGDLRAGEVLRWARARIAAETASGACALSLDPATADRVAREAGRSWRRAGGLLHRWAADAARDCEAARRRLHFKEEVFP